MKKSITFKKKKTILQIIRFTKKVELNVNLIHISIFETILLSSDYRENRTSFKLLNYL